MGYFWRLPYQWIARRTTNTCTLSVPETVSVRTRLPLWLWHDPQIGGTRMGIIQSVRRGLTALLVLALASCTTTQAQFDKNPKAVDRASLCRTYLESYDQLFRERISGELASRGVPAYECPRIVQAQNQAALALAAVALVGTAVAVCANNNCGGGYYRPAPVYRGNCQYAWQYDSMGRQCGARAASVRPGGW